MTKVLGTGYTFWGKNSGCIGSDFLLFWPFRIIRINLYAKFGPYHTRSEALPTKKISLVRKGKGWHICLTPKNANTTSISKQGLFVKGRKNIFNKTQQQVMKKNMRKKTFSTEHRESKFFLNLSFHNRSLPLCCICDASVVVKMYFSHLFFIYVSLCYPVHKSVAFKWTLFLSLLFLSRFLSIYLSHRVLKVSSRNLCLFWLCTAGHW